MVLQPRRWPQLKMFAAKIESLLFNRTGWQAQWWKWTLWAGTHRTLCKLGTSSPKYWNNLRKVTGKVSRPMDLTHHRCLKFESDYPSDWKATTKVVLTKQSLILQHYWYWVRTGELTISPFLWSTLLGRLFSNCARWVKCCTWWSGSASVAHF